MNDVAAPVLRGRAREAVYLPWLAAPGPLRLLSRLLMAGALLAALDLWVLSACPPPDFGRDYRMPRTMPTSTLAAFADHIERTHPAETDIAKRSVPGTRVALFLGASPTYGQYVKGDGNTFAAAFERAAGEDGRPLEAYNLASNGQYASDAYVIAKRLADDADVVYVQLTYHTFNPRAREGRRIRYEELPALLGVELDGEEAEALGVQARRSSGPAAAIDSFLRRWWALYRERDRISAKLFGRPPEKAAQRAFLAAVGREADEPEDLPGKLPEIDIDDPGAQGVAFAAYAQDAAFRIDPEDEQVAWVRRLARLLREEGVRTVFYVSPMNVELIDSFGLLDPGEYAANVGVLRQAVREEGFDLLDFNTGPYRTGMPGPDMFADVNHTNDEGAVLFGERLYEDYRRVERAESQL